MYKRPLWSYTRALVLMKRQKQAKTLSAQGAMVTHWVGELLTPNPNPNPTGCGPRAGFNSGDGHLCMSSPPPSLPLSLSPPLPPPSSLPPPVPVQQHTNKPNNF